MLTATAQTQGRRTGDYHWCIEGELVTTSIMICDRDAGDPDGGCGCGRGWNGLNSHKATTTAMVREVDMDFDDYVLAVESSLTAQGWTKYVDPGAPGELAAWMAEVAADYPVGTVMGHRLREPYIRWLTTR